MKNFDQFLFENRLNDLMQFLTKSNQSLYTDLLKVDGVADLCKSLDLPTNGTATDEEAAKLADALNNRKWYDKLPASYFFDSPPIELPGNTKLIHFAKDPEALIQNGFTKGTIDFKKLGMSWGRYNNAPGWNYAFEEKDLLEKYGTMEKASAHWGGTPVVFECAAVKAYHYGDEIDQCLFWGPDAQNIQLR